MSALPGRPRVLVVEDSVLIQESIRLILQRDCEIVATAEDGPSALAAVAELKPDLVTIDVSLPGQRGFSVAEEMAKSAAHAHVIFLTAYSDRDYVERAFEIGAKGYILKGAMQTELPAAIRAIKEGARYLSPALSAKLNLEFD